MSKNTTKFKIPKFDRKSHKPTCMIDMQFAEKNEITQAYLFVALRIKYYSMCKLLIL